MAETRTGRARRSRLPEVRGPVLVVGGAGFVGSHVVERLLAESLPVEVVDDLSTGSLANLAEARAMGGELKFHHLDAASIEFAELVGLRRPDLIVHLAALHPGATRLRDSLQALDVTVSVLEAARHHGVRKVVTFLPAALVYGEVEVRRLPVKEGYETAPAGVPQLVAKSIREALGVYREVHAVEYTSLIGANVYGLRQRPEDGVVASFASAIIRRQDAEIFGTGKQARDFVYIDDAVDAIFRALTRGDGLDINVGTGTQTTVEEVWKRLAAGSERRAVKVDRRAGDVQRVSLSPIRARIQLGWQPWTSLDDGLKVFRNLFLRMPSELRD
ncbi:MAG: NAD-dependent epimerase/dehydratase family protein [Ilumatobacteraceae bacterium]